MKILVRLYNKKNKLIARRIGGKANWKKLYGKLASAVAHKRYLKVEYGVEKDVHGRNEMFYNEYEGEDVQEAKKALSAFLE